jgi:hypothetical protein
MTELRPDDVWDTTREALHAYADQLRREAASRSWGGPAYREHRARMRARRQLALDIEEILDETDPTTFTRFLMVTRTRPRKHPGGLELWAITDNRDADERARMWGRAGHPYHRFSGGEREQMCRICTGPRDATQHRGDS